MKMMLVFTQWRLFVLLKASQHLLLLSRCQQLLSLENLLLLLLLSHH
jgi:hypothetical protein